MFQQSHHPPSSPPLHHPIPQHPIPPMRSPPPVQQPVNTNPYIPRSGASGYGEGGEEGQGRYGNLFNDATAQVGLQVGRNAMLAGQEYVEQNFGKYFSMSMPTLKSYFNVSNSYVLRKLFLILFPWRHKPWARQMKRSEVSGTVEGYRDPRDDINAPDMYIPVMAFTTYILLSSILAGIHGVYHPEILGYIASMAFAIVIFEILGLKLGCYLLSISNESQLMDLVAYSGYKFIGVILTMIAGTLIPGLLIKYTVFLYTFSANAFFLLRSLRYVVLPESTVNAATSMTTTQRQRQRRIQFLFVYSFMCQFVLMWLLVKS
ncbi:YIF1-domain-containing protein [Lipomyces kononenkoae]|uniref:YIF1-domain-containing protein n=1 Tax=Lipomyces kononenkoae TaxID=34357 RepID=A0ACC3T0U2_LIPKO